MLLVVNIEYFELLALLNEIEKHVLSLKEDRNFIHIAEFNQKVAEIDMHVRAAAKVAVKALI